MQEQHFWLPVKGVKPFLSQCCIHPLKQRKVSELIEYVKEHYPNVNMIAVFGSSTTLRCHPGSDIDIIIDGDNITKFIPPDNDEYDVLPYWELIKYDVPKTIKEGSYVVYRKEGGTENCSRQSEERKVGLGI